MAPLALMVTRHADRRYVGTANIALTKAMRVRLWARVEAGKGSGRRQGRGRMDQARLVGRVSTLKREDKLRHATLRSISDESDPSDLAD
ncbi:hypothetical protein ASD99_29530 [Mesorhizobium sp. Root695]|nr:hypothetical protein ASD99_29530 [Mesorhizobium sp. Root695]